MSPYRLQLATPVPSCRVLALVMEAAEGEGLTGGLKEQEPTEVNRDTVVVVAREAEKVTEG